jgi:hypothetical protein
MALNDTWNMLNFQKKNPKNFQPFYLLMFWICYPTYPNYHEIQCCNNNRGSISCQSFDMAKVNIGSYYILRHSFQKRFKLVKIAIVQMLGSIEDKRTFSILSFMKLKIEEPPSNTCTLLLECNPKLSTL